MPPPTNPPAPPTIDARTAFFADDAGDGHLYLVVVPRSAPETVVVSLTTHAPEKDQSCVLDVGDHPFIKHPTCVEYGRARVVSWERLEEGFTTGRFSRREDASIDLMIKVWAGADVTNRLSLRCRELIRLTIPG